MRLLEVLDQLTDQQMLHRSGSQKSASEYDATMHSLAGDFNRTDEAEMRVND
ncbi:TPA: hypothetical protein U2L92_001480 [Enterobacter hormaechei]|nr:hypothetical protein [Enterobacter hormaechei]